MDRLNPQDNFGYPLMIGDLLRRLHDEGLYPIALQAAAVGRSVTTVYGWHNAEDADSPVKAVAIRQLMLGAPTIEAQKAISDWFHGGTQFNCEYVEIDDAELDLNGDGKIDLQDLLKAELKATKDHADNAANILNQHDPRALDKIEEHIRNGLRQGHKALRIISICRNKAKRRKARSVPSNLFSGGFHG